MGFIIAGIIIITLVVISGAAGAAAANDPNTGSGSGQIDDNCEACRADRAWYRNLRWRRRVALSGWWIMNQARCALRGC